MRIGSDTVAIVTGGASGLGAATVRRLANKGAKVAILDRDEVLGRALAEELKCHFAQLDVSEEKNIVVALNDARNALGQERVLVNCAGVAAMARTVRIDKASGAPVTFPYKDLMFNTNINLVGSFMCASHSAAGMASLSPLQDGERGAIINVSSTEAVEGKSSAAAYAASKAGVIGMTLPMARDLRQFGIRVNTILPGFFKTGVGMVGAGPIAEAYHEKLVHETLFPKRPGVPDEFAFLVEHIIENAYINATDIRLDAGLRLSNN